MAKKWTKSEYSDRFSFLGFQNHCRWWLKPQNWRHLLLGRKADKPRQHIKKQRHHFVNKGPYHQSYGFSSSHIRMWEFDRKEGWALKNWCLELWCWRRLLRAPWAARRSNQSNLNETNPEYSLKGLMIEAEVPILLPPNVKSKLIGKDPDGGKDWGQ